MQPASVIFFPMVQTQIKKEAVTVVKVFHGKEDSVRVSPHI